jgi:oligosaccharide repeat unit polymerase
MVISFISALLIIITLLIRQGLFISPGLTFSLVWLLVSLLSFIFPDFISSYTDILISLCVICFSFAEIFWPIQSKLVYGYSRNRPDYFKIRYKVGAILFINIILLFCFYFFLMSFLPPESLSSPIQFRNFLVEQERSGGLPLIVELGVNIPIITCLYIATICPSATSRSFEIAFVVAILGILPALSKGYLIFLVGSSFYIFYLRKLLSLKRLVIIFYALLSLIILLFVVRDSSVVNANMLFKMYTIAPTLALSYVVDEKIFLPPGILGEVSKIFMPLSSKLHSYCDSFGCWAPNVDVPTNVYTIFGFCVSEYGIVITIIIFLLLGFLSRFIISSALASHSSNLFLLSCFLFVYLATSYFSDGIFAFAPTNIKYLIVMTFFANLPPPLFPRLFLFRILT